MSIQNTQFVKYTIDGATTYEARHPIEGIEYATLRYKVFSVIVPEQGPGDIKTFTTELLYPATVESSEKEWELEYMKVLHNSMEGEFIDD